VRHNNCNEWNTTNCRYSGEGHFLEEQWYPHKEMPTAGRVVEESQIVPI
jgi:hypothetical protein